MAFPPSSISPPALEDYQWFFNGLLMGRDTPFGVLNVEGLDLADIRSGDVNLPRDHGQLKGLDLYGGKDVILDLWMKTDGVSLQESQMELATATIVQPSEEIPLWFKLPNLPTLCVMCRPRKRTMKVESDYAAANIGKPELSLHATDPRIYEAGVSTTISPNHPATTVTLKNTGNTEMRPILTFTGPITNPFAQNTAIPGEPVLEVINPLKREEREAAEPVTRAAREKSEEEAKEKRLKEEAAELHDWNEKFSHGIISGGELAAKIAAQKVAREKAEKEEKEAREKAEKEETEKREAEEKSEREAWEKSEDLTIKAGDKVVVTLGPVHVAQYFKEGNPIPDNVLNWVAPGSVWWDLLAGNNPVKFGSIDTTEKAGKLSVEWAPAREI